jgi:flagellin
LSRTRSALTNPTNTPLPPFMSIWSLTKSNFHSAVRGVRDAHSAVQTSHAKLASGRRTVTAGVDAAGLAVATNLDASHQSTQAAKRNASDALSALEISSGGLSETNRLFKRMRELAVQASSDTLDGTERAYLETEFQGVSEELARIRDTTEFNGIKLLDGSLSNTATAVTDTVGTLPVKSKAFRINDVAIGASVDDGKSPFSSTASALAKANIINERTAEHGVVANATNQQIGVEPVIHGGPLARFSINRIALTTDHSLRATREDADGLVRQLVNELTEQTGVWADLNEEGALVLTAVDGRNFSVAGGSDLGFTPDPIEVNFYGQLSLRSDNDFELSGLSLSSINIEPKTYEASAGFDVQVGLNNTSNDQLNLGLESSTNAGVLQLDDLSLSSLAAAQLSLEFIDHGLDHINTQQATVGASMNRLGETLNLLTNQQENLKAASSQITDTDMALEAAVLIRANIMRTATSSVLAQAQDLSRSAVRLIE